MAQENPYASEEFKNALAQDVAEPNYFTLIFGLVFVIFLIYLTGFFYQRLIGLNSKINKKSPSFGDLNKAKILSCTPLGQGKSVYVIEINGKNLVLGATQNNVNLLREFSKEEIENYSKILGEQEND